MFHPNGPSFFELVRQAVSSTERGYDLLADKFEYTPFRTPDEILVPTIEALTQDRPVEAALDICCGTGAAMAHLHQVCTKRLVGIDFSQGMLAEARARVGGAEGLVTPEFVCGDVLSMDFRECFDLAVCFGAQGHILPRDEGTFLERIHGALAPGGRYAFVTSEHPPKRSLGNILSRLFNAGMHVRNAVLKPEFVMYYLTFLLPEAKTQLEEQGFEVEVRSGLFDAPFGSVKLVIATRK